MMIQFTLRQLSFFSETARCGGIAQAARNLNVSAAAVSSAIDKLEDVTGLTLFDRFRARGMRLTRVGAAFLKDADALLMQASALGDRAAEMAEGKKGTIVIGTHYAIAQKIILPAVLAFRHSHPGTRIEVVEDDFPNLVSALDAGEADALVVFDQGFDPQCHQVEILKELPPLVLLPVAHPLARAGRVNLEHLKGMPYIAVSRSGPGPSYLDLLQSGGLDPEVPLTSQSSELVQAYVGKGLGFTLVGFPPEASRTIEGDAVVARPLVQDIGHFNVVIARPRGIRQPEPVKAFLDACLAQV